MKRVDSSGSRPAARGKAAPKSVDDYLAGIAEPARSTLLKMRKAIRAAVPPEAVDTISYGMPAVRHHKVLVWYAAFSDHCSLFPTAPVIEAFKNELKKYSISKGTIRFPLDKPLPAALVRKLVKARIALIENKKRR